ncbi:MAG: EF2563 family selenium-dependent molybdenum hydroxylase system protein [Oscillospiraceae bacterium]|jgi:xanthine dehydrogenase accessory factor|nr:EF2563 family selenium-dependent molybdenum hydroxylase system protein [Oscillospiraceae bacterium]
MLVLIRGAGDIASGIALRLHRAHAQIIMTDLERPTAIRRSVCFSQAIVHGSAAVEGISAKAAHNSEEALQIARRGEIAVLADPQCACLPALQPAVLVDAILAKRNLGTKLPDAPCVIGVGPGFTAGVDCHAAVETMRGHFLGRVITSGSPLPNSGVPGNIGGFTDERILRAPADGVFRSCLDIGAMVQPGDIAGEVAGIPMRCRIGGVLRGILADGTPVHKGMKSGDVDPRGDLRYCHTVSDKALAVGGAVLEAILRTYPLLEA